MFDEKTKEAVRGTARRMGIEPAALLAVAEVESGGVAFTLVDGRREPLIRFEGHYFDERLSGEKRGRARIAGLASPVAGQVANPKTQAGRWRLLAQAAAIDQDAAHESVSWGLGQVMGAHWRWLGFDSVHALVSEARCGVDGQIRLMARYIEKAGLVHALRKRDWKTFARAYNGPAYAGNGYQTKIAAAYERYRNEGETGLQPVSIPDEARSPAAAAMQDDIRELQRMLSATGYPIQADGIIGPATRQAIRQLQADSGLTVDGIAGPKTVAALREAMPLGRGGAGLWAALMRLIKRLFRTAPGPGKPTWTAE